MDVFASIEKGQGASADADRAASLTASAVPASQSGIPSAFAFPLSGYPLYTIRRDEECGCCEGKGNVPPAGNRPYFDREEVLCVECDGTGEV